LEQYSRFEDFSSEFDSEVNFIAEFLRKNTRIIENKYYIITFNELDKILQKYGFLLKNPDKNQIGIYQRKATSTGLLTFKETIFEQRIGVIKFPGWKTQVPRKTVNYIRQITGLTRERGYDSETFFRDGDPLSAYIDQYQNLLIRLADK
jgi:hypothetical protein